MKVQVAKNPKEWNAIVENSPFSVLFHRFELISYREGGLPLIVEEANHKLLFPLRVVGSVGARIATSPIYCHASLLLSDEESGPLIPAALEAVTRLLRKIGIECLVTSVPTFILEPYGNSLSAWFEARNATRQNIYVHTVRLKGRTFEEIWMKDYSKDARNIVRRAERRGVHVETVEDVGKHIRELVLCNISALKRHGRPFVYPHCDVKAFLEYLLDHKKLLGEYFQIYGAFYDNRLIAYITTMEYNKLAMVTSAMSRSKYLRKYPNDALVAHITKRASERGLEWFCYSFDRVSVKSSQRSLLPSLRKFKFEHGFREVPVPIYRLGLNRRGKVISHLARLPNYAIIGSASLPMSIRRALQYGYDLFAASQRSELYTPFNV